MQPSMDCHVLRCFDPYHLYLLLVSIGISNGPISHNDGYWYPIFEWMRVANVTFFFRSRLPFDGD